MRKKTRAASKKKKIKAAYPKTKSFPIVGIGASAGGLEAYQELLKNLSAKPGMAFVFIMHLSPGHKSLLTELLARLTKMPVSEVKNGTPIEVNHVYIIPPSTNISITSGKLMLSRLEDMGLKRMPIDWFFRSLAEERGNRAIGVILSGTATDGTLGAEAIKAEGGITFAQDEKSAKYTGMPQSAVSAGCVDFVLSPKKIARELERIAKHPYISFAGPVKTVESIITEGNGFERIFDILRLAKGLDFSHYKTATISRRVSRRMVLLKLEKLEHYVKFLRENKDEVENLYEDLLINVTSFFRDPKVFDALEKQVLPAIFKNKKKDQQAVRIWVPGCSSGEEAYSIAICILETLGNKADAVPVQIFATDVSESGINKARRGIYGKNTKDHVTPERLKRFFKKEGNSYRISKQLREMCIFSRQNVFSDPPFSNIDLISCRNLLIYMQPVLQKNVFHNFHYALRPGGFLLLGNSEAAGGHSNLFKTLDRKQRIFVKKYLSAEPELELGQKYYPPKKLEIKEKTAIKKGKETDIAGIIDRIVLSEYAPCGVLIDSNMEVVQFRGHTGRYLESAAGKPSLDIFKLAREELFLPLRAAIYKARETKHTIKREAEDVKYNGHRMGVNITVVPVKSGPLKEEFFLVLFDEIARAAASGNLPKGRGKISLKGKSVKSDKYVNELQKELAETKEYLQAVIEEQESANEEVKTANEEILSSNEELQSTNEELETAKEELQSTNEELTTTNEELQNRNAEVSLLNNDLINLLSSINMPVVMMGTDLVIRRITPQAEKVLNVIPSDIGRPISKIKLNVDIPDLEKTLLGVIETLHPKTFEIKSREGNWYSVYIRPYRTLDNKINGVVAIFIDITERKRVEKMLSDSEVRYRRLFETAQDGILILDAETGMIVDANPFLIEMLGFPHERFVGKAIWETGIFRDIASNKNKFMELQRQKYVRYEDLPLETANGPQIEVEFVSNVYTVDSQKVIQCNIRDITERKRLEEELKSNIEMKSKFTSMASHELRSPLGVIKEGINLVLEGLAGNINNEQRDLLDTAKRNTDRLGRLINNVLDFQKMDSGKMWFDIRENDINEAVLEVNKAMGLAAKGKGLDLAVDADDSIPRIRFDKDKIIEVLTNLVSNAIKYTEKGSITISTKQEDNTVHVLVRDTGKGIKAEDMQKLFQAFEQLGRTRDKKGGGTGLGLAISKEIILAHKGKIWAESKPGKGSTFHFTIPKKLEEKKKIGEILVEEGKISEEDVKKALEKQEKPIEKTEEVLTEKCISFTI